MNKLEIKNEGKSIEVKIYGEIGDCYDFEEEKQDGQVHTLDDLDKVLKENKYASIIDVYINSTGGSVFDGIAIYNMLKRHRAYKRVFIEGFACSIASVIAMAGNSITMPKSSMMMIHNAWTVAMGNAKELRKVADDLEKINDAIRMAYMSKFKNSEEDLAKLMDDESYLTAEECYEYGLCTKLSDEIDEESVNEALEKYKGLYSNKLKTLQELKNAIRSIDEQELAEMPQVEVTEDLTEEIVEDTNEEVEEVNDEVVVEEEVANETDDVKEVNLEQQVMDAQVNVLKRFFNKED